MQKDLSKLRSFDYEAWDKGADVCCEAGGSMTREMVSLIVATGMAYCLRMAPLGWLDGFPVYGDQWVYRTAIGDCVQAAEMGCPALALAAGNVRWPTEKELTLASLADGFIKDCASAIQALRGKPKRKNLKALRPFDYEAWIKGAKVCAKGGTPVTDSAAFLIASGKEGMLRMAPLSWVDGEPVYEEKTSPKVSIVEVLVNGKLVGRHSMPVEQYSSVTVRGEDGTLWVYSLYDHHS